MPHLREIPRPKCVRCSAPARVEMYNDYNAPMAAYCKSCGARALREEQQKAKRLSRGNPW